MTIATVHQILAFSGSPPLPPPAMVAPLADADGDGPLATVMDQVAAAMQADGVLVAWHDGDREPVLIFASGDCPTDLSMDLPMARARGIEGASEWRIDAAGPDGGRLTTSIPTDAGVVTITSLFHDIGDLTSARARDAAGRLLPLIQPFFRLWSARRRTLSRVRGLTAAVNKSDVGIVLIDREGHPIFTNATAEALIAEKDGLRRSGGMLNGTRLADTLRLHAAIEHVIAGTSNAPAPVVALQRRDRRPLLAAVVACEAQPDHGEESAAIIYLFDPERDLAPLVEPACKLYGLSPVETRLTCLLADGINLAEAAVRMHVREQTARSYLKQIFLKTETNRQAELVWLMLKSSVRTVPGLRASLV
jgi:DNA-binding CsgD family transcriptional regulator